MPAVNKDQALKLLTREVEKFETDELLEVYNEAFPDHPYGEKEASKNPAPLVEQLVEYIHSGLEIDVLMELWSLIIPRHRNIWYDEVEEKIHYNEEAEAVSPE